MLDSGDAEGQRAAREADTQEGKGPGSEGHPAPLL